MQNYAKVDDGVCVNAAVFENEETAVELGYPVLLPESYGIGDLYDGKSWSHAPTPAPDIEGTRTAKLSELSVACNSLINAGSDVQLSDGTTEHFSYTVEDQANVSEMFTACIAGATGYIYHADNAPCKTYSSVDIVAIYSTLSMFKTGQITYHNQLKQYVNTLKTVEEIQTVTYGQGLTGEYLLHYSTLMQEAQEQMQAVLAKLSQGMSL